MRHYDNSCGPNVLRTNEKGWRTRIRHQTPILPCSGVLLFVHFFSFFFRYFFVMYVIFFSRSINTHTGDYGRLKAAL